MIADASFERAIPATLAVPSKAAILAALLSGQSLPASELAYRANVSQQTASFHLRNLLDDGFIQVRTSGRHRYYSLAGQIVADALEKVSVLTSALRERRSPKGQFAAMRGARMCYDHIAGRLGVALLQNFRAHGYLHPRSPESGDLCLSERGEAFFARMGLDLSGPGTPRRKFAYECIDWTERTPHLAGALGASIGRKFEENGWIQKHPTDRALILTPAGRNALSRSVGLNVRLLLGP